MASLNNDDVMEVDVEPSTSGVSQVKKTKLYKSAHLPW